MILGANKGVELAFMRIPDVWSQQVPVGCGRAPKCFLEKKLLANSSVAMQRVSLATISGCGGSMSQRCVSVSGLQVHAFSHRMHVKNEGHIFVDPDFSLYLNYLISN